jgi:hypothetical protein
MKTSQKLSLGGGILILIGLLVALYTNHYSSQASVLLADRVIVDSLDVTSPETLQIKENLNTASIWFYIGFTSTAIGILFQLIGIVIESKKKK